MITHNQLSRMEELISALKEESSRPGSPVYAFRLYAEIADCARRLGHVPRNVLEIGPGANLGTLFCFACAGCEYVAGVDIAAIASDQSSVYRQLKEYLTCVGGFRWWRSYAGSLTQYPTEYPICWDNVNAEKMVDKIVYRAPYPMRDLPFEPQSFDFTYSVAVLEHVTEDVQANLEKLYAVMLPGGLTVHEIDLWDHNSLSLDGACASHPLRFLELSAEEYAASELQSYGRRHSICHRLDGSWRGGVTCNRLRRSQWLAAFETAGFEDIEAEVIAKVDESLVVRSRLSPPYRDMNMDDLCSLVIRVTARRRQSKGTSNQVLHLTASSNPRYFDGSEG
jgi:SAM-dependent methyltransferase